MLEDIKGIGPKTIKLLERLGIKELRKKAKTARKEIIFHFSLFIFHF